MFRFKLFLMVFLGLGFAGTLGAQEVQYSEYDKFDFRTDDYAIAGMCGGKLYTYRHTNDGAMLDAYDDSMNKTATVLLDFFPPKIYQTRFVAFPDRMIILYQALESNKVVQYAALLDERGMLRGKPIEIASIKTGIFGATRTYFSSAVSENKKNIVIFSCNDKGSEMQFDGKWLDDKLTVVKRSKAVFKTDNDVSHGDDVNISNDGIVYISAYTPTGSEKNADQFWILALTPGATKFEAKELPLDNRYAANGYIKVDNVNKTIYFGGFYADRKNGSYDGIIYAAYDLAGNTFTARKFIPFDQQLIASEGSRRRAHAFDNFQVRQVVVKNDGGFVLVSEVQYVTTRSTYTPGFGYYSFYSPYSSTTVYEYHYNDIMTLAYNKDGVREWATFVPKEQYSQEDNGVFSSYAMLNTGGALAFLYNDFNTQHSRIQMATVAPDGQLEVHSFTAEGNDYPDWLPRYGKQVAGRVLLVPCFHKKQICFAKVVF